MRIYLLYIITKSQFFYCLGSGRYVCSNCDNFMSSANKRDWLQHTQDFHNTEFNKLVENQRTLTRACSSIKADDEIVI